MPRTWGYPSISLWELGPSLHDALCPLREDQSQIFMRSSVLWSPRRGKCSMQPEGDSASFQKSDSQEPNLIMAFAKQTACGQFGHSGSQLAHNFLVCLISKQE